MNSTSTLGSDGWVRRLSVVVPFGIRRQFLGELMVERSEMRAEGSANWRIRLHTFFALLIGLVQHVPLVERCKSEEEPPAVSEKAAGVGWLLWRASGPMIFAGYALSLPVLIVLGALALVGCFASIGTIVATSGEIYGERCVRILNAVFGGLATVLAMVVVAGAIAAPLAAASSAVGVTSLGAFTMQALVFFSTTLCAVICLSGWVPEEWEPSRIINHH